MGTKPASKTAPANRRNFFRINQDVVFDYRPVDAYQADNVDPADIFETNPALGLVSELRRIDRAATQSLKALAEKDPALGDYLHLLTQKVDLLARHTLLSGSLPDANPRRRINLSEAGIAFDSDKTFYKGKFLAVRLLFLPGYVPVTGIVEVVRCRSKDPGASEEVYEIAAKFHHLPEKERQELSRQILRAQVKRSPAQGGR